MPKSKKNKGLYLVHLSIHGLVRGYDMELGRDADTGGQVKYVVELARALGRRPEIARVDLITRRILDEKVDPVYGKTIEKLGEKSNIVRIPFGPKRYLRKEVLWPHLDELTDRVLQYFRRLRMVPDIIHGHYADAGLAGAKLAQQLGIPFIFTGHSLGLIKKEKLIDKGRTTDFIESRYNISTRIEAEEMALGNASMVITSTSQERDEQYLEYDNHHFSRIRVIPPGVDLERFYPYKRGQKKPAIADELERFLHKPSKPMVLALSRPDERKNISTLVKAFGNNPELRQAANLVLIAGNRQNIRDMDAGSKRVLTGILLDVDKYDLYGMAAYPKNHHPDDVPELYRLAMKTKGVFVNPALTEPFGLTLLEAGASGLPLVATDDGGPRDIIGNCQNGILVDPLDEEKMGQAVLSFVQDRKKWKQASTAGIKGVRRHYSWETHSRRYIKEIFTLISPRIEPMPRLPIIKSKLPVSDRVFVTDIDNTLLGNRASLKRLLRYLTRYKDNLVFGVATGRTLESTLNVLAEENVPIPEIIITAVGSEIYYGPNILKDHGWSRHIDYRWKPEKIKKIMREIDGVELQSEANQREFKLSYNFYSDAFPGVRHIRKLMRRNDLHAKIIHSHAKFLDFLPLRASKGLAIRYICMKWGVDFKKVLVAGDSGNDREMLSGNTLSVVVGNYSPELKTLTPGPTTYFAADGYSAGIIEGMKHFGFLEEIDGTKN
ncbi:HAD-IIB family hydrolase [Desulfonatronovibrio hydrogenovorans]|uniref:HAD-IIB family hydrolase n=1 Tax=Desulfonatronovibrio hydrogenovorans TaxID=53245 RepID=UPI000491A36F|nr:HAD-IIB family hydrolase [Desulfonatronovibrio hydrogenovorans]